MLSVLRKFIPSKTASQTHYSTTQVFVCVALANTSFTNKEGYFHSRRRRREEENPLGLSVLLPLCYVTLSSCNLRADGILNILLGIIM